MGVRTLSGNVEIEGVHIDDLDLYSKGPVEVVYSDRSDRRLGYKDFFLFYLPCLHSLL